MEGECIQGARLTKQQITIRNLKVSSTLLKMSDPSSIISVSYVTCNLETIVIHTCFLSASLFSLKFDSFGSAGRTLGIYLHCDLK